MFKRFSTLFIFLLLPVFIYQIYGFNRDGNEDGTMPVELVYFTALQMGEIVQLNWETATELSNYGFNVERKYGTNTQWQLLGFVEGHGTSYSPKQYTFSDTTISEFVSKDSVFYRLQQIDNDGNFVYPDSVKIDYISSVERDNNIFPMKYELHQNFPNPFNPVTNISFETSELKHVRIVIYDIVGNEVETLVDDDFTPGNYTIIWNGAKYSSGVYLCKMVSSKFSKSIKLVLLK